VGVAPIYPPFVFKEGDQLAGVEIEFARQLESALGVKVEIQEYLWEDLIPALADKRIDVAMSGISITDRRKHLVAFTEPYLRVGQMALIRAADITRFADAAALNAPEVRIGVHLNTTGQAYARQHLSKAKIKAYTSIDDAIEALRAKEIDVFIHDAPTVWRIRGRERDKYPDLMGRYRLLTDEYLAWAVRKDDDALRARLNGVLAQWEDGGTIEEVLDRWIPVRKITVEAE
jgi:polar amino acid transport system substrate-binding protein